MACFRQHGAWRSQDYGGDATSRERPHRTTTWISWNGARHRSLCGMWPCSCLRQTCSIACLWLMSFPTLLSRVRGWAALQAAAQANGGGNSERTDHVYSTLRRRLIDYPVVSDRDVLGWEREFDRTDGSGQTYVRHLVNGAYIARPQPGGFRYLRCPGCGNTVPDLRAACGTPGCSSRPAETASTTALAVVYEQHRATRRFIRDPGLVEARLLDALML